MQTQPNSYWPQPMTFGGVAALARAPRGRLLAFQTAVALLAAGAVGYFFESAWVPVITHTIQSLPASGGIQNGRLTWARPSPLRTANSTFLWISIDPADALEPSEGADFEVELKNNRIRVRSLFGYLTLPYPADYTIGLNRNEVEPWWGAWHPAVTVGLSTALFLGLFVVWGFLGWLYAWPVRLISFYADRDLTWFAAWRLSLAALLPGALLFVLAIVAYSFRELNFIQLLAAAVLHVMVGWVYVLFAPFCLPRAVHAGSVKSNPIKSAKQKEAGNPFAGPSEGNGD
jgi:hypothetical protein